jgi:hypothetical protein
MKRVSLFFAMAFLFLATGTWAQSGKVIGVSSTTSCTATPTTKKCTITLTWPNGGFTDTNYNAVCQVRISGRIDQQSDYPSWFVSQTTTSSITIEGVTSSSIYGAAFSSPSCVGVHD